MNKQSLHTLLCAVTEQQKETGQHYISYHRLHRALSTGPSLNEAEKETLWLSPAARRKFCQARKTVLNTARQQWHKNGLDTPQQRLAASSEQSRYDILYEGYRVILEQERDNWVISLVLSAQVLDQIPVWAEIMLVDEQGEVWLQGCPNGGPDMMSEWQLGTAISSYVSRSVRLQLEH